jgi:hypothetical protein
VVTMLLILAFANLSYNGARCLRQQCVREQFNQEPSTSTLDDVHPGVRSDDPLSAIPAADAHGVVVRQPSMARDISEALS